ncbi:Short-chain dehydrogenase [Belliella buryatensis]|uniref:Short-chain dehydrogenase n=1 Tax=Belliella buryatensis TaxID=1500549 RepID=A0A239CR97_9BACT|nr:SDR family NAD(P)-dependent oxidoreductase [Belliella buryatensis]SNS22392.1 Short-chain dehydrogenase [Belliella buryatensis]
MKFQNHIVWITGASSGIGLHLAKAFAKEGAIIAASARRMALLEALVLEIKQEGGSAQAFFCDVMDEQSIEKCMHDIVQAFGKLDVCVANAGGGVMGKIEKLSADEWDRQLRLNVTGLALTAKYALPELRKTNGRLALIGSVAAFVPNPNLGAYGASKAAVQNIGETLQSELLGSGVSCTTIHPGFVDSNITRVDNDGNFHPEAKDPRPANLIWPTEKAAVAMVKSISKRKKMVVITGHGKVMYAISRLVPGILRKMMAKMNG